MLGVQFILITISEAACFILHRFDFFQCSILRKSFLEPVEVGQHPWILKRLQ